jgi:hypothetical protein
MSDDNLTFRDIVKGFFAVGMAAITVAFGVAAQNDRESAHKFLILGGISFFICFAIVIRWLWNQKKDPQDSLSIAPKLLPDTKTTIAASQVEVKAEPKRELPKLQQPEPKPPETKPGPPPFKPYEDPQTGAIRTIPFPNRNPCAEYFRGVFCGIIWSWHYKSELGQVPVGLVPLCPECERDVPLRVRTEGDHPLNYTVLFKCPYHSPIYKIPAWYNRNDDLAYIKDLIKQKIADRSWEDDVDNQRAMRGY